MTASFLQSAQAKFQEYKNALALGPHNVAAIQAYRSGCCCLLQEIAEKYSYAEAKESLSLCRLGLEIAAEAAETRVCETREGGCLIVRPDICPADLRDICIDISDKLAGPASGGSKMYIAPRLERTPPDPQKCMAVLRLYDMEKAQRSADRQSSNRDINRLFGSRG